MDLEDYREQIDRVNKEIVDAVSRRMDIVEEIGEYKKRNEMDVVDSDREEEVKQQFEDLFSSNDLPPEKGREMADMLIDLAVEEEKS